MRKRKFRFLRIIGWIAFGVVSLILLVTLVFYLGRDYFVRRAVSYLNEQQPGKVQMGQMNLIPFQHFPNVSLHLEDVRFYESEVHAGSSGSDPILSLKKIAVTLDLVQLIKGGIMLSEARLEDGFVHMEIYEDSVSNLEHALGIRFGEGVEKDSSVNESNLAIDLEKIELVNLRTRMDNRVTDEYLDLEVNQLKSSFSSLAGKIQAALEVDLYINLVKYQTINDQVDKQVKLKGSILMDSERKLLVVEPSSLNVSGLDFETWGTVDLNSTPRIDLAYNATNEGLELLNYLFMGILDLEDIEQIGGGSIHLNGTVQGNLGDGQLPVVRVNGEARELGFNIKTVNREVKDISFRLYATNGGKQDLSESYLDVQGFTATFPEGRIDANMTVSNIKSPELNIEIDSKVKLEGLEEMLKTEMIDDLSGSVALQGHLSGKASNQSDYFLNDEGWLSVVLEDVSLVLNRDSVQKDSLAHISGEIALHDSIISSEKLDLQVNGNRFDAGLYTENLMLYLLGYDKDVTAEVRLTSEHFHPATLLGDTSITDILGEEVRHFYFSAKASMEKEKLDNFLEFDSIPEAEIIVDSFGMSSPMLADISGVGVNLSLGRDTLMLRHLEGTIGESKVNASGRLVNFGALSAGDSGEVVTLDFNISSDLLRAEDLLTFGGEFLLPEDYSTEHLEDFRISGSLEAPASGLVHDSVSMDFALDVRDMGWGFRYYPNRFRNFLIEVRREGDMLVIDNFQGTVGEDNLKLSAMIGNFTDTLVGNMYGSIELYSDLLDLNQLMNYQLPEELKTTTDVDSSRLKEPLKLNEIDYPQFDFTVNIGELRYDQFRIYGMNGNFRSTRDRIFYLERLVVSPENRGTIELNGQLNLANAEHYIVDADIKLSGIHVDDLNIPLQSGDTVVMLKDNFQGVVNARGLAELYVTPDLQVDMPATTAQFNVMVNDGTLNNFTPLQAAGKFLDTKDLNNVRFDTLRNSFTLMDSKIEIPLMFVKSTLGLMLIQGEQGLDGSYLYLVRVPPKLAMQAARSAMAEGARDDGEDQVSQMKRGDFLGITVWSNGTESDFKLGDRRSKYQQ